MSEAPERIWAVTKPDDISADILGDVYAQQVPDGMVGTPVEYVRADRIEELEANLAMAVEALERIEDASKYFGNCPEASETTVRYAHETTRRLARTTLAELTGGNDE